MAASLACRNRVYRELRAGVAVAADKDVRLRSLIGQAVGLGGVLLRGLERTDVKRTPVNSLAYCADYAVYLDDLKFSGADGLAASPLVRLAKLHLLDLYRADSAVCADDFNRRLGSGTSRPLPSPADFLRICGHLRFGAAVEHIGLLRAETHGTAAYVHRNVAAAYNGAPPADVRLIAEVHFRRKSTPPSTPSSSSPGIRSFADFCAPIAR